MQTDTVAETAEVLRRMESWLAKSTHSSLTVRPKSRALWGSYKSKDWAIHMWQSFTGVSAGRANLLYDHLGLPLAFTCTKAAIRAVPGVGPKTVDNIWEALPHAE